MNLLFQSGFCCGLLKWTPVLFCVLSSFSEFTETAYGSDRQNWRKQNQCNIGQWRFRIPGIDLPKPEKQELWQLKASFEIVMIRIPLLLYVCYI